MGTGVPGFHLEFSILTTEVRVQAAVFGVRSSTSSVYSIVFGARYYLPKSTYKKTWRPYLAAAAGPYIGAETKSEVGATVVTRSHTETAIGGYLGGGLDIELSRYFMVGISGGYNLITDFSESVGSRKNYSSPEFAVGISYLFGRGLIQEFYKPLPAGQTLRATAPCFFRPPSGRTRTSIPTMPVIMNMLRKNAYIIYRECIERTRGGPGV